MELYGSIQSISGSMTASVFTGSFVGDGSGLYGISASGVTGLNLSQISTGSVTASVSPNGFNVNSNTSITGTLKVSGTIVAEQIDVTIYSSSVLYQSGSTRFGDSLDDNHDITGSVKITGSISLNGQAIGTGKLDETVFNSYTASNNPRVTALESTTASLNSFSSSTNSKLNSIETSTGSLNSFTSSINTTIKNKLNNDGVISGSVQIDVTQASGYSTFSSSIAATDLSQEGRLTSLETTTSSLNNFSNSINVTIKDKLNIENVVSSSNQISLTGTNGYTTFSSSIATTDSLQEGRLNSLETSTGSLNTFSSSVLTKLNNIETSTSSLNSFTSSTNTRLGAIETSTSSLNSYTSSTNVRIGTIESTTSSLNTYTSSNNSRLNTIESTTGSLNIFTSSANDKLNSLESTSASLNTATSSLNSFTSSTNSRLGSIETSTGSLNTYTSSTNTRLNAIETSTSSLNTFTSSINTTIKNKLNTDGVISGSAQVTLSSTTGYSTFSSSLATTDAGQDGRLNSLEGKTGSYATTGSNIFQGNQTITGSLYVSQDLIIAGSSSIQHISSSVVNIADNIITVNAQNPSIRFGGLAVIDSGSSPQVSGSILFDSVNDQWIFVHQNQTTVTSSILLMGPQTFNNLGNETFPSNNRLLKSVNAEHLGDSNITDTGTKVSVNSNTEITGSLIVAGGNKITVNSVGGDEGGEILLGKAVTNTTLTGEGVTIDVWQNRLRFFEQGGNARGGYFDISTLGNGVATNLNVTSNVTALESTTASLNSYTSSNTTNINAIHTATSSLNTRIGLLETSTGSLNSFTSSINTTIKNRLNTEGVISGSSQINHNTTTNYDANQHVDHTSVSVTAGNGLSGGGTIAATRTLTLDTGSVHFLDGVKKELNTEGVVSGSSQITYSGLSGIPSGIVSGSSQISFGSISGLPSGLVSGSSQVLAGTTIHSGSFFNGISVVSGSAQISFGGITGVPSGLVSGSSQITLSSTTGYGSVINQAVLTTSSPTFSAVSATTFTGALSGNASTASSTPTLSPTNNTILTQAGSGTLIHSYAISSSTSGLFSTGDNSNSVITFNRHPGDYYSQLGFNSTGGVFYRSFNNAAINTSQGWQTVWTSSSLTNLNQLTNGPGYITGISFANVSSKPTTLSGYGITDALSNNADSEQDVGTRNLYYNDGVKRVFSDPRWNESGYDGDLGTLHIYSTTAAGANYGRAGIALYNGSAYQYLTTKGSTTGLFANNSLILTAGNYTSYAMAGAGYSANQNLNTSNGVTFATLRVGSTSGSANGSLVNFVGGNYNQFNLSYSTTAWGLLLGYGDGTASGGYHGTNHAAIINVQSGPIHFGTANTSNVQISTSGHFHPTSNNTYDCGTSSLAWRNVYTNDLHLSNMNKEGGNDIDGTNGNWTIQEGAENLYIINNNNGKKFKISLEEII